MSWVIAVLLALILIAIMSSNENATAGVRKFTRITLITTAYLASLVVGLLLVIWYVITTHPENSWWENTASATAIIMVILGIWFTRKDLWAEFKRNPRETLRAVVRFIVLWSAIILGYAAADHIVKSYEISWWWIIVAGMALPAIVLVWRSSVGPDRWGGVWVKLGSDREPRRVLDAERAAADEAEQEVWRPIERWESLPLQERAVLLDERQARLTAAKERLRFLDEKIAAEQARECSENEGFKVRDVFWLFATVAIIRFAWEAWEFAYDYAMGMKESHGKPWISGVMATIAVGFGLFAISYVIFEFIADIRGKFRDKQVKQGSK